MSDGAGMLSFHLSRALNSFVPQNFSKWSFPVWVPSSSSSSSLWLAFLCFFRAQPKSTSWRKPSLALQKRTSSGSHQVTASEVLLSTCVTACVWSCSMPLSPPGCKLRKAEAVYLPHGRVFRTLQFAEWLPNDQMLGVWLTFSVLEYSIKQRSQLPKPHYKTLCLAP